jgi:hypothetical protein
MKFPSAVTFESSVTSIKADEKLLPLSQNQQSRSGSIVSMLQHTSQDFSAPVDCTSARSTAVVRIPQRNHLQLRFAQFWHDLTFSTILNFKTQMTSSNESMESHMLMSTADVPASFTSVHGPLALFTVTTPPPSDENFQNLSSIDLRAASVLCGQDPKIPATKNYNPVERLKRR